MTIRVIAMNTDHMTRMINRIKGILIILVVMDHNEWFRLLWPKLFEPLTFHVLGFFLLSFTASKKTISLKFIADRVARYLVPFWWTLALSSVCYYSMTKSESSLNEMMLKYLMAALLGSAITVKNASGLYMMWFLPCLFGLTCLLALIDSLNTNLVRLFVWILAILCYFLMPNIVGHWISWIPFGIPVVAYIFIFGLTWRKILNFRIPKYAGPLSLLTFTFCYALLMHTNVHIEIGTLEIYSLRDPLMALLHLISVFTALFTIIWVSNMMNELKWIENIGISSLLIYLIHPFFYFIINSLFGISYLL